MKRDSPKIGLYPVIDIDFLMRKKIDPLSAVRTIRKFPVRFLQVRWKSSQSDREFYEICSEIRKVWRKILIINDRTDIALAVKADGVHLGDKDLPPERLRRVLPRGFIIGLSTHSLQEIKGANRKPVDYISFGSIFPTDTKGVPVPVQGREMLKKAVRISRHPLVAIGGIKADNIFEILDLPISGISMISGLLEGNIGENLVEIFEVLREWKFS